MRGAIILLAGLLASCANITQREALDAFDAPTAAGIIASFIQALDDTGTPPTFDQLQDVIVDCVDDYRDTYPATSDLMTNFADQLDCVCYHDYRKRISRIWLGYEPNPLFGELFCPAQPTPADAGSLEEPSLSFREAPPAYSPAVDELEETRERILTA